MTSDSEAKTEETEAPINNFVDYNRVILDLSADLHVLADFAKDLGLSGAVDKISKVVRRLQEDTFSVAVVGEFKRGKSTFINALLGVDVMPTDVLPSTATLNRVTYGVEKRAVIDFKDGRQETIDYDALSDYVTKKSFESEEVAKTIAKATVYYPSPYCQNRVDVIDTPGLNDEEAMSEVTLSVLPEVDAAILVILAQSPFGEYERQFLESRLLTADLGRVIFVVNGIDRLNTLEEADRVVQGIEQRIKRNVMDRAKRQFGEDSEEYHHYVRKIGAPKVFGLSAYEALESKKKQDIDLSKKSRFPMFEKELQKFLTEQRGAAILQVPLNRALATCTEILETLATKETALSLETKEFEKAVEAAEVDVQELENRQKDELARIDDAGDKLKREVVGVASTFVTRIRTAVLGTIDSIEISASEIGSDVAREAFGKRLKKKIDVAASQALDQQVLELEGMIAAGLAAEVERLKDFDNQVAGLMSRISQHFNILSDGKVSDGDNRMAESAAAAIAVFTGFGGIWGGYRSAGWKGAGLGAAASLGTAVLGGVVLGVLSLPVSLPAVLAIGVTSFFTGRWASDTVFSSSRVEEFRKTIREAAAAQLDRDLVEADVVHRFQQIVQDTFSQFRTNATKEVEQAISSARGSLANLREQHARGRALGEEEGRELQSTRERVQSIGERALRLSGQLASSKSI